MITPDERAVLLRHCSEHVVAVCPGCATRIEMSRLGADLISGRRDLCPSCGMSVVDSVRQHLAECPSVLEAQRPRTPADTTWDNAVVARRRRDEADVRRSATKARGERKHDAPRRTGPDPGASS
jgi:hypothetical protein